MPLPAQPAIPTWRVTLEDIDKLIGDGRSHLATCGPGQGIGEMDGGRDWLLAWIEATETFHDLCNGFPERFDRASRPRAPLDGQAATIKAHVDDIEVRVRIAKVALRNEGFVVDEVVPFKALIMEANQRTASRRKMEDLLATASERIFITDPYIDRSSIDVVVATDQLSANSPSWELLTDDTHANAIASYYVNLNRDMANRIEVRHLPTRQLPHDRFVILDQTRVYLCGGSLNGLGNRTSMVIGLNPPHIDDIKQRLGLRIHTSWQDRDSRWISICGGRTSVAK